MKNTTTIQFQPTPSDNQLIFSQKDFVLEVCMNQPSKRLAYQIRYRSYLKAGLIHRHDESLFFDEYDAQVNSRIFLVRHQGKPVATLRSSVYSDHYRWTATEGVKYFRSDIVESLGGQTRLLECGRFAVDPDFQGRQSLIARLLLFWANGLNASLHQCAYVTSLVRSKHLAFYQRFLNLNPITTNASHIAWVDDEAYFLANRSEACRAAILKRGMPDYDAHDIYRYAMCANLPLVGERQIVA